MAILLHLYTHPGFPGGSVVKNLACNAGDLALIPGLGRSLGRGHSSPLQYSFLENPTDEGAWQAAVHRVAQSRTRMKQLSSSSMYSPPLLPTCELMLCLRFY